jgi:hypothetical protein
MRPWRRPAIALKVSGVYIRCDFATPARGTALVNRNMRQGALILALLMLAALACLEAQVLESRGAPETYVGMTPAELAKHVPELKHLVPASSQELLPEILRRVGATVAEFFDNFSNTTCTEHVVSAVDAPGEPLAAHYDAKLNYVALVKPGGDKTRLEEYRTDSKGKVVHLESQRTVVTIGFVSMTIHFHPRFQADSRFSYLGREKVAGQDAYVVAFAQRPGVARRTSLAVFKDRTASVLVQGVAWIDPVNFRILRLRTDIERPDSTVSLVRETTEIDYFEVTFKQSGKSLWLPRRVNVSGQMGRYTYQNLHGYSNYRLFVVQTEESGSRPPS